MCVTIQRDIEKEFQKKIFQATNQVNDILYIV